jgi:hypothetical protein
MIVSLDAAHTNSLLFLPSWTEDGLDFSGGSLLDPNTCERRESEKVSVLAEKLQHYR